MNLNVDQIFQQFLTPKIFFQSKQIYSWTKERHEGHKMLQATLIISSEVQTGEA
jgi:hypothetical protein